MTKYICFQYNVSYYSQTSGSDVVLTKSTYIVIVNNKHGIFRRISRFN